MHFVCYLSALVDENISSCTCPVLAGSAHVKKISFVLITNLCLELTTQAAWKSSIDGSKHVNLECRLLCSLSRVYY